MANSDNDNIVGKVFPSNRAAEKGDEGVCKNI